MKIGNDIVYLPRMQKLFESKGIPSKIYTAEEKEHVMELKLDARKIERMAGKYAVKEAVVKAMGTGLGEIQLVDVEVLADECGKPTVNLTGKAKEFFDSLYRNIDVSISHDGDYVFAVCILE